MPLYLLTDVDVYIKVDFFNLECLFHLPIELICYFTI